MIIGGNATVFVKDMDQAVDFYTKVLGMKLRARYDNHWAEVEAGNTLLIGLHPQTEKAPPPGTQGSVQIGLTLDQPLVEVVERLKQKGVQFDGPIVDDKAGIFASFRDPDGHLLYFWETKPVEHC